MDIQRPPRMPSKGLAKAGLPETSVCEGTRVPKVHLDPRRDSAHGPPADFMAVGEAEAVAAIASCLQINRTNNPDVDRQVRWFHDQLCEMLGGYEEQSRLAEELGL